MMNLNSDCRTFSIANYIQPAEHEIALQNSLASAYLTSRSAPAARIINLCTDALLLLERLGWLGNFHREHSYRQVRIIMVIGTMV